MYTSTTQLADCLYGERMREADRARLTASARAAGRSVRRACRTATPASRIIRAILLRPAMQALRHEAHPPELRQCMHVTRGQAIIGYVYGKRG